MTVFESPTFSTSYDLRENEAETGCGEQMSLNGQTVAQKRP